MLAALLATALFCISAVTATRTARVMGGTEANFWRLVLATILLGTYSYAFGCGLGGPAFPLFFLSGAVGFGVGDMALFQALPRLGSRLTILLVQCLAAPLAAACEWFWLHNRLEATEIYCGLTILGGVALALAPGEHLHIERRKFWPGIGFALLAAFGQGFGAVLSRQAFLVTGRAGEDLDGVNAAFQRIIAGVIFAGIVLLIVKREHLAAVRSQLQAASSNAREQIWAKWKPLWRLVTINALAGPALGVSCYLWALKYAPSGVVLPIVAMTPLVIIPLSAKFEGEKPSLRSLVGGVIAVAGAVALAWVRAQT